MAAQEPNRGYLIKLRRKGRGHYDMARSRSRSVGKEDTTKRTIRNRDLTDVTET